MGRKTGVHKRKVKSLLENNRSLVNALQNYRQESSSKEAIWTETSTAALEHIFSAKSKLNKLAAVLKEAYLSVEEVASLLQLCSSIFPSRFSQSRKRKGQSKVSSIESIKEVRESLSKADDIFITDVLKENQDGNLVCSSTNKADDSGKSCLTDLPTKSTGGETDGEMPQKLTDARESVVPAAATSTTASCVAATKNLELKKACIQRKVSERNKRKPSESKATKRLPKRKLPRSPKVNYTAVTDEILPVFQEDTRAPVLIKKSKLSIELPPISDEVLPSLQVVSAKKSKHSIASTRTNVKQSSVNPKSPLSTRRGRKRNRAKTNLNEAFEKENQDNRMFDHISQCETPVACLVTDKDADSEAKHHYLLKDSEQNKDQSQDASGSCELAQNLHHSEEVMSKDSSKTIAKHKMSLNHTQLIQEQCSDFLTGSSNALNDGTKILSSILTEKTQSSANKYQTRKKVNFSDDATIDQRNTNRDQHKKFSKNQKGSSGSVPSQRPILQSVENISCSNENLSKNILVVSAEIHQPPSHSVPTRISPRNARKNMQPCVILTDIFDSNHQPISSLEDLTVNVGVKLKEPTNSKASNKDKKKNYILELEKDLDPLAAGPRSRNTASYKEPRLNVKMRRL